MSYRPKIKANASGGLTDLPLDAETIKGIDIVDSSTNKIKTSVLPAIAISETFTAASQAAMLALTAQVGDVCIRTDESKTYILVNTPASTLANWLPLNHPADAVSSVNGKTGAVTLSYSDVGAAASDHTHSQYLTGITKSMVTTALGYTPPTQDTWRPLGTGASDACAGNDSRLSDSRPASDVYPWAKQATKPSYTATEVGAAASSHTHGNVNSDGTITSITVTAASGVVVYDSSNNIQKTAIRDFQKILCDDIYEGPGYYILGMHTSGEYLVKYQVGDIIPDETPTLSLSGSSGTVTADQWTRLFNADCPQIKKGSVLYKCVTKSSTQMEFKAHPDVGSNGDGTGYYGCDVITIKKKNYAWTGVYEETYWFDELYIHHIKTIDSDDYTLNMVILCEKADAFTNATLTMDYLTKHLVYITAIDNDYQYVTSEISIQSVDANYIAVFGNWFGPNGYYRGSKSFGINPSDASFQDQVYPVISGLSS